MKVNRLLAFAIGLTLAGIPALAEDKPTSQPIDMTQVLMDDAGRPAKDQTVAAEDDKSCSKCPPLTLGLVAYHALLGRYADERELSAEQSWARGALAQRIKANPQAQLSVEEVALIKKVIAKGYGPIVVMQAFPILDPNAKPPEAR